MSSASLRHGTQVPTPTAASPGAKSPGKRGRKKARDRVMNLRIFFYGIFCYLLAFSFVDASQSWIVASQARCQNVRHRRAASRWRVWERPELYFGPSCVAFEDARLLPVLAGDLWRCWWAPLAQPPCKGGSEGWGGFGLEFWLGD